MDTLYFIGGHAMGLFGYSKRRAFFSRKIKEVEGHVVERSIFGRVKSIGPYEVHRTWWGGVKDDSPVSDLARYVTRDDRKLREARITSYPEQSESRRKK